jgi:hypothetical protein
MTVVPLGMFKILERLQPIRRLSRADCDRLGFEGPLVLSMRQVRSLFGPWRTKAYVVVRHPSTVVLECTKSELLDLGVDPEPSAADGATA